MINHALYNIPHWGQGYFAVNEAGVLCVQPLGPSGPQLSCVELSQTIQKRGLECPVLVRFNAILHDRVRQLQRAFDQAIADHQYENRYTIAYPIKVNQQRRVIEELLKAGNGHMGLEAGSKPELLAVLGLLKTPSTIICNGYKDSEYIRLALIAKKMGHQVYIIIEKVSELDELIKQAASLAVVPLVGLRVRLASIGVGHWQNSGGEKAKFGLTPAQVLQVVDQLKQANQQVRLLHFHLGSQVPTIRAIQTSLKEAACFYAELWRLGMPIEGVDVGGGLGVDYEGTRSRSHCSMNYTLEEYAKNVVAAFAEICGKDNLPHPRIISESGRALTAHHAMLLTRMIDREQVAPSDLSLPDDAPLILKELQQDLQGLSKQHVLEAYHTVVYRLSEVQSRFMHGLLTLKERAKADQLYQATCLKIRDLLDPASKPHRKVLDELNERLADKLFMNFSLFQSIPDVWAINQVFPVLPLSGFNEPIDQRAVIQDMTCDSDGRVDCYVDGEGIETTLPIPSPKANQLFGFFLVGAYQEILGDIHNLFGDTHSVHVAMDPSGDYHLSDVKAGETITAVLRHVDIQAEQLLVAYQEQLARADLNEDEKKAFLEELVLGLKSYTYLT